MLNLIGHMALHRQQLARFLPRSDPVVKVLSFVNDDPVLHIGRVVWNEISALEEMV